MAKLRIATAGMLSLFLLSACGGGQPAAAGNSSAEAQANESGDSPSAEPAQPTAPVAPGNGSGEPVPPPDAVSHPDGYLPPAPSEPEPKVSNAPGSPATEDQYIRNGQ